LVTSIESLRKATSNSRFGSNIKNHSYAAIDFGPCLMAGPEGPRGQNLATQICVLTNWYGWIGRCKAHRLAQVRQETSKSAVECWEAVEILSCDAISPPTIGFAHISRSNDVIWALLQAFLVYSLPSPVLVRPALTVRKACLTGSDIDLSYSGSCHS
jgi:hypothetical protein